MLLQKASGFPATSLEEGHASLLNLRKATPSGRAIPGKPSLERDFGFRVWVLIRSPLEGPSLE